MLTLIVKFIHKIISILQSCKRFIKTTIQRIVRFILGYPSRWEFDLLSSYVNYKNNIRFIQVGSNSGMSGDPIFDYITKKGWQGILVEPVPYLFDELKNNYKDFHEKLLFENSAIATKNGSLKFYRLKKSDLPNLPYWYDQIGSFKKEVVLKHRNLIPSFDDLLIEDSVNTITFEELLKKHSVESCNLIHIDTEGYDFEIIKMIPIDKLDVDLIMFEHKHLSDSDYRKAAKYLQRNGYNIGTIDLSDSIAVKKTTLKRLVSSSNIS